MIENSTTFMTGNVRDNCYQHIRLLPRHPHLASADFIRLLPVATSAHPLITHSHAKMLSGEKCDCAKSPNTKTAKTEPNNVNYSIKHTANCKLKQPPISMHL